MQTQLITKEELSKLAQTIRDEKSNGNIQSILWAVQYHLPLVLWNIERPIDLVNALLIACFNGTDKSICNVLGLERSLQIGSPICQIFSCFNDGKIKVADNNPEEF